MISAAILLFKTHWRGFALVAAITAFVFLAYNAINNIKEQEYNKGVATERSVWQRRVDAENIANRKRESDMLNTINSISRELQTTSQARDRYEQSRVDHVETIIRDNPVYRQCVVDQDIINLRNEIRAGERTQ